MYRLHFTNFFYIFLCFLVSVFIFQEYEKELPGLTGEDKNNPLK